MIHKVIIFIAACLFVIHSPVHAKYQSEFTPSISIAELYDDNIDLEATNEKEDWVTTISPGITLNLVSEGDDNISLRYNPTLVRYKNEDQNNTVRHSGTLAIRNNLTSHLRFDLSDTYLKSEEPVETTEGIYGVRQTRNIYQRNTGSVGINFLFGPENTFNLGYDYSLLNNEDVTLDDSTIANPNADLILWFNQKNGVELNYQYTIAEFTRDDDGIPGDDYTGNNSGLTYRHRFGTRTTFSLGYELTDREFEGLTENYSVHDGSIGFTHSFTNQTSLSMSGGYFLLKNEYSDDDNGFSYDLSLTRNFSRGNISIGGSGGWRESFLEAEQRGLTKYYGMDSNFSYQVTERLSNYAGLSYLHDKDAESRITKDYRANYGWRLSFLRWFSIALDYTFMNRNDEQDIEDYKVNRIMMTLTASRMFR